MERMTLEEKAALERVRETIKSQIPWEHPIYERTDGRSPKSKWDFDCYAVVRLYLREHPADDDEPVTEEWLRSVGFVREEHPNKFTFCRKDAMPLGLWKVDDGWKAMLIHSPHAASCIVRQRNTRGDVRRLVAALGIALKEPSE